MGTNQQQIATAVGVVIPTTPNNQVAAATRYQKNNNIEERLNQIQEYIKITTSLINSVQGEHVSSSVYFYCYLILFIL